MMPFTLPETVASLDSFTGRVQNSGPDKVPAVSINLVFIGLPATLLDSLNPELRPLLWEKPAGDMQQEIPGEVPPLSRLKCRDVGTLLLPTKLEGWVVDILYGIDPPSVVSLPRCKIDKIHVTPQAEGLINLKVRVGSSAVEADAVGELWAVQKQDIRVRMTPPRYDHPPPEQARAAATKADSAQGQLLEDPEDATTEIIGRLRAAGMPEESSPFNNIPNFVGSFPLKGKPDSDDDEQAPAP